MENAEVAEETTEEQEPTEQNAGGSSETETKEPEEKLFRVKIDGEEREVTEKELIRDYQLKEASYKRMAETGKLANSLKPYMPVIDALKKGDLGVLKQLGIPKEALRKFSEEELLEFITEQEMSPEQREAEQAKRERDEYKKKVEESEKQQQAAAQEKLANQAAVEIEKEIVSALKEIDVPLKGNYRLVRRMAEDMFAALEAKMPKVSAAEARDRVLKGTRDDFNELIERELARDPEKFIESLPEKFLDGIRKRDLKRVRSQLPMSSGTAQKPNKSRADDPFRELMKREFGRA